MLVVCRKNLAGADLDRLETLAADFEAPVRWNRRGERLVLHVPARPDNVGLAARLAEDPAVEYVLQDPSQGEIARLFTRRELLDWSIAATGLVAGAALLGPLALYFSAPPQGRSPAGSVRLGRADSIPVNGARIKLIDGKEYLVIRQDQETFRALAATCTHSRICLLGWDPQRRQVVCPCHRGIFDVYGNVVSGPPPEPLARREVFVRDGDLYARRTA